MDMAKSRIAWLAAATLLGLFGVGFLVQVRAADAVTEENIARLTIGLTAAEVEAVFGRPADESEFTWCPPIPVEELSRLTSPLNMKRWYGKSCSAIAVFEGGLLRWHGCAYYAELDLAWYQRIAMEFGLWTPQLP